MSGNRNGMDGRAILRALTPIALIATVFVGSVLGLHLLTGIDAGRLTRDPASVERYPFYVGYLSYVGVLLWSAAAAVCLFSAWQVRSHGGSAADGWFLGLSGLVSLWLMSDDLFMLHEEVLPTYVGLPESLVYVVYVVLGVAYAVVFRRSILKTDYPLLGLALVLVGSSVALDLAPIQSIGPYFVEDSAKFAGIATWFVYWARASSAALRESVPRRRRSGGPEPDER